MRREAAKRAISGILVVAGLLAASPAAACFRSLEVQFEGRATNIANRAAIADFLEIPTYGPRQKVNVEISAPEHDLASGRVAQLVDMLAALGLDRGFIRTRASRGVDERAMLVILPGPLPPLGDRALAQVSPPASTCGSRR